MPSAAAGEHLGSVSMALYLHDDEPERAARTLLEQARTALDGGFHGITISEHHAGFPGYVPVPATMAATILGATRRGWVAPSPILLPLRPVPLVMEEIAWLAASHPGRVAAGLAAGYSQRDFDVYELDRNAAAKTFRAQLAAWQERTADHSAPLHDDPAISGVLPKTPVLVCTGGPKMAALAARNGFGLFLPPVDDHAKNRPAIDSYRAADGIGPCLAGQWVWLGEPPPAGLDALAQAYPDVDDSGKQAYAPGVLHEHDPNSLADRLHQLMIDLGLTGISLRVHLPGVDAKTTSTQIQLLAEKLVPRLEARLSE
ncbi:LLM class flavin-dependent oxidoreductase [Saccharopolyspora sp. HNM0986]|uniref:LLM class flavin-dependent oxidoreductase n=1 Tax=Saccharopolyspora galaxeae TaxID=2781241 RepID=UPI00190D8581|nr:LLM class flavin-dependent oxidoreductase [Saccharopolyspora sp. HNM0986]MBK0870374.1 LLM class flavin-dependent oxidoreductase [Saccharopolyspora sp. HNM0986]